MEISDRGFVYGLFDFDDFGLLCERDVLGRSFEIVIGGQVGTLEFPTLQPGWPKTRDPLREFLLAPPAARTWRRGP